MHLFLDLQKLEALFQEWDGFTINIPELKLLKQYHSDAISWISRLNDVLMNIHEREDQENVVSELSSIQSDGESLKIQGLLPTACILSIRFFVPFDSSICQFINCYVWLMFLTVGESSRVEIELKKARCRVKALKVILLLLFPHNCQFDNKFLQYVLCCIVVFFTSSFSCVYCMYWMFKVFS